jgi:hypothetical protein
MINWSYAIGRILNPSGYIGLSPYMPQGYFLSTPALGDGPALWRLFDASFISSGTIDPNRLGSGSTGAGNLYLADDGSWKLLGGGGGGDMLKATYDVDNDGVVDSAETTQIIVRNSTGSTLTKGQVVYLSGATGNRPNAVLSRADTEVTATKTIGIVVANISNNSDGYVAVSGTLHNLDTSAFADGVAVWLSATTAGGMTSTIPAEPNHTVFIGYVARSHPTQGRLVILIQNGYELNELHGVLIASEANNDLLTYESSTGLWKNKTFSAIFGGTPLVSVPTLAQVTTAGNTTTNAITVGGLTTSGQVLFNAFGAYNTGTPTLRIENVDTNNVAIQIKGNVANYKYYWIYDSVKGEGIYKSDQGRIDLIGGTNIGFSFVNNYGRLFTIEGSTGNVLINTTTDAGYKLDVNGAIAARTGVTIFSENYLRQEGVTAKFSSQLGIFKFDRWQSGPVTVMSINGWNQESFINTPLNIGTTSTTMASMLSVYGSRTATSALAQGVYFNNTLVAAANNDVLVGLDINPTFTNGAFTGVSNWAVRITNPTSAFLTFNVTGISGGEFGGFRFQRGGIDRFTFAYNSAANFIISRFNSSGVWQGDSMTVFNSTGNIGIGTSTDAGYKLDVNGNTAVRGILYVTDTVGTLRAALQGYDNNEIQLSASRWVSGNSTATLDSSGLSLNTNATAYGNIVGVLGITLSNTNVSLQPGRFGFTGRLVGTSSGLGGGETWAIRANADINITDGSTSAGTTYGVLIQPTLGTLNNVIYVALRSTVGNVQLNTTSGNTLIGTTTDSGYKLDVVGDINTTTSYRVGGVAGWTGTITIIGNPPGQQNVHVSGGIITNVT